MTVVTVDLETIRGQVSSILGYCQMLSDTAQAEGHVELIPDIRRMWDAARKFLDVSNHGVSEDPLSPVRDGQPGESAGGLRLGGEPTPALSPVRDG
ncbi:MAG: hypothetical protein FJX76_01100, partial [Armatimonadetes bacterium]|nr:hypothetical protein [Armatimonadota bacterium]